MRRDLRDEGPAILRLLSEHEASRGEIAWVDWIDRRSPTHAEVDCLATFRSNVRLAIEHTEAEGLPQHQMAESQLHQMESLLPLTSSLGLAVSIRVPIGRIKKRTQRVDLAKRLDPVLAHLIPLLPVSHEHVPHRIVGEDLSIFKFGGGGPLYFTASPGDDADVARALEDSLQVAVEHKNPRLGQYKRDGFLSILLIQVIDISGSSISGVQDGIKGRLTDALKANLDEVWFLKGRVESNLILRRA